MRRFFAIVRATVFEIFSEPLALLVTMSALSMAILSPAVHYHRFSEPSRMARDASLSSILIGGLIYVIFCMVKTLRREIETGTMQMAISHSVSRSQFLVAKVLGVFISYLAFVFTLIAVSLTVINGAEIGGRLMLEKGINTPLWGPSLVCAVAVLIVPPIIAAILNRFANFRWTLTTTILSLALSFITSLYKFDCKLVARFFPVAIMLIFPTIVFLSAALLASVRFRENIALSCMGIFFLLTLPLLGNYYLSDVLMKGGSLPLIHLLFATIATVPIAVAFVMMAISLFEKCDVGGEM